jgi:hypothetical protein
VLNINRGQLVESCKLCKVFFFFFFGRLYHKHNHHRRSYPRNALLEPGNVTEIWKTYSVTPQISLLPATVVLNPIASMDGEFIISQSANSNLLRPLKTNSIDFEIIRAWLRICREKHTKACTLRSSTPVLYMKVIDCKFHRFVPAMGKQYVALSYVWGTEETAVQFSGIIPAELPLTIQDAITVTLNLGYRFLWIDRYYRHTGMAPGRDI